MAVTGTWEADYQGKLRLAHHYQNQSVCSLKLEFKPSRVAWAELQETKDQQSNSRCDRWMTRTT